jgi:hypothetical protein
MRMIAFACALVGATLFTVSARAELKSYYVSYDTRAELTSGTYLGLPNPNYNHISLMEAAPTTDHFHGISTFAYTGDPSAPTVVTIPETRIPPVSHGAEATWIPLTEGASGSLYEGKLITSATDNAYTDLTFRSVQSLEGSAAGTIENTYFTSSGGRWSQPFPEGPSLGLELVSLSPGLHVGSATELNLADAPGDVIVLGDGDTLDFLPVLWMDAGAAPGKYAAEFKLIDTTDGPNSLGDSGVFGIHVEAVPEPSTVAIGLIGLASMALLRRRAVK